MNQLRTVEDFARENIQFIDGDMADYLGKEVNIVQVRLMNLPTLNVKSFAWRKNEDGVTPKFQGEVEYELENGEEGIAPVSMLRFEKFSQDYNPISQCVKQWRPHIAKEHEPVVLPKIKYTAEDAAAGKMPLIGSLAHVLGGECIVRAHDIANGNSAIQYTHDNSLQIVLSSAVMPVPTEFDLFIAAFESYFVEENDDDRLPANYEVVTRMIYNGIASGRLPVPKINTLTKEQ